MTGATIPTTPRPQFFGHQDVPPPGGYPKIQIARIDRKRGPSGLVIWAGVLLMSAFGFYRVGEKNALNRTNHKEKRELRMAIVPYLQIEVDRKLSQQMAEEDAREAEIMKDNKGWVVGQSVYSKRWNYKREHQ